MYKQFRVNKKFAIAIERFQPIMKTVSIVFKTGIRNWDSPLHYTYSLVIGNFRIMFYIGEPKPVSCG